VNQKGGRAEKPGPLSLLCKIEQEWLLPGRLGCGSYFLGLEEIEISSMSSESRPTPSFVCQRKAADDVEMVGTEG